MALYLAAKAPEAIYRYTWAVPVADGDSVLDASFTVTTGTVTTGTEEVSGSNVIAAISGGAAGEIAVIAASATTADGETITDTIYLPVRSSDTLLVNTVYDVCAFALRKIAGIGESADADELDLATEVLNDMLAEWRIDGMDIGIAAKLASDDVFSVRDEFVSPVKYNLAVRLAEEFDRPLTQTLATMAAQGQRLVSNALLSFPALSFEGPCIPAKPITGINDL